MGDTGAAVSRELEAQMEARSPPSAGARSPRAGQEGWCPHGGRGGGRPSCGQSQKLRFSFFPCVGGCEGPGRVPGGDI